MKHKALIFSCRLRPPNESTGCIGLKAMFSQHTPLSLRIGESSCVFRLHSPESDSPALTVSKISADQSDLASERIGTKAFPTPPPLDFSNTHIHTDAHQGGL